MGGSSVGPLALLRYHCLDARSTPFAQDAPAAGANRPTAPRLPQGRAEAPSAQETAQPEAGTLA